MSGDNTSFYASLALLICFVIGSFVGALFFDDQIGGKKIAEAVSVCADRGIDYVTRSGFKCADGGEYAFGLPK